MPPGYEGGNLEEKRLSTRCLACIRTETLTRDADNAFFVEKSVVDPKVQNTA